jgi:hypothetical protein
MGTRALKFFGFLLLLVAGGCTMPVAPDADGPPKKSDDPDWCGINGILYDQHFRLNDTDIAQFRYDPRDTLVFVKDYKDTVYLAGTGEKLDSTRWAIFPCDTVYNFLYSRSLVYRNDSITLNINIHLRERNGWSPNTKSPDLIHVMEVKFYGLVFRALTGVIQPGYYATVPSTTLLSYKLNLIPGGIMSIEAQGGAVWRLIE